MSAEAMEAMKAQMQNQKKFFYRGIETHKLLDMSQKEILSMLHARARRRLTRAATPGYEKFMKKVRKAMKAQDGSVVKTHLRNAIIMPDMVAAEVAVYTGKKYVKFEIKPNMIGHYLGEFAMTYTPVKHGKGAAGAGGKFMPIK